MPTRLFRNSLMLFTLLLGGMFLSSCDEDVNIPTSPTLPIVVVTPAPSPAPTPTPISSTLIPCPPLDTVEISVRKPNQVIADATPVTTSMEYCKSAFPYEPLLWRRCPYGPFGSAQRTTCEAAMGNFRWFLNGMNCIDNGSCEYMSSRFSVKFLPEVQSGRVEFLIFVDGTYTVFGPVHF